MKTSRKHHCKDCRYWKVSIKAGLTREYSQGRYQLPKTIRCIHLSGTVGRMDSCPDWKSVPDDPTCFNCIHLNPDDGRAHLYGYGFCTVKNRDNWVNVETKRSSCKYHEFRGSKNEYEK